MKRLYETAETLVYDPVTANRNTTRASLNALGFRKVELAPSLDALQLRVQSRPPDLLLAEITGSEAETCALIQAVRQGNLGENPFIVIIATTWKRDGNIVSQVLNSGADDLVGRPVSASKLGERIRVLAERRKAFVVTSDYVGPDRRGETRVVGAPFLQVPNALQVRTRDNLSEQMAEREIATAVQRGKELLNVHKLRSNTVQLCVQWRILELPEPSARDFRDVLPRIDRLVGDIKRLAEGGTHAGALEGCETIAQSVRSLLALTERSGPDMKDADYRPALSHLGEAVLALGQDFAPGELEPARIEDLDRIAATLRKAAA